MLNRLQHPAILFLLVALPPVAHGQTQVNNLGKVFEPVEASLRQRLAERLGLLIEYERAQQWGKLYDLMYKPDINNKSREEFVRTRKFFNSDGSLVTLDFIPQTTLTSRIGLEGNYFIEGCLKVRWKGKVRRWHAATDAYLVGGEWYFNGVATLTGIDAPPQPCKKRL